VDHNRTRARQALADQLAPNTTGRPDRYAIALGRARADYTQAHYRPAPLLTHWNGQSATRLRRVLGLSGRAFADYLGITESTVSGWTTHPDQGVRPDVEQLLDIALARTTQQQRAQFHRLAHADLAHADQSPAPSRPARPDPVPADAQEQLWRAFLARWHDLHGPARLTAKQLWESTYLPDQDDPWDGTFPAPTPQRQAKGAETVKTLGKRLTGQIDRWHGDLVLRAQPHAGIRLYWVEAHPDQAAASVTPLDRTNQRHATQVDAPGRELAEVA
jgi:transcriptional regulator with XRE-family HTH domain